MNIDRRQSPYKGRTEPGAKPCRVLAFWGNGGLVLGLLTALAGQGIWICTEAVEATVHRHLNDQLFFLRTRDAELHSLIAGIQLEELHHLHYAAERITSRSLRARLLRGAISMATEAVIWLSTWGDSTRMAKDLAAARAQQTAQTTMGGRCCAAESFES